MFDIQQFSEEPAFGLLSREDKKKIDASLTKAEASEMYLGKTEKAANADSATRDSAGNVITETYVTKGRAICDAVVSDSGVVFLNGLGEAILTIPIYNKKKSPQLSVSPARIDHRAGTSGTITITRLGDGAITFSYPNDWSIVFDSIQVVNGNINYTFSREKFAGDLGESFDITVNVAETDEYESATATCVITGF